MVRIAVPVFILALLVLLVIVRGVARRAPRRSAVVVVCRGCGRRVGPRVMVCPGCRGVL